MSALEVLELAEHKMADLCSAVNLDWMKREAARFVTPTDLGFEFPLSGDDALVDLFVAYRPLKAELQAALQTSHPAGVRSGEQWKALPDFDELWFELDSNGGHEQAASVFVGSPRSLSFEPRDALRWLGADARMLSSIEACCDHADKHLGWLSHLGIMQRREGEQLRANLRFPVFGAAADYLRACGLALPPLLERAKVEGVLERLAEVVVCRPVHADPATAENASLVEEPWSLELFPRNNGGVEPELDWLLMWLIGEGFADGLRAASCMDWPEDLTPMESESWPLRYMAASLLDETPRLTSFAARFSHIKLSFTGERFRKVRGYVAFSHVWR